jgi:hypothetical protein
LKVSQRGRFCQLEQSSADHPEDNSAMNEKRL